MSEVRHDSARATAESPDIRQIRFPTNDSLNTLESTPPTVVEFKGADLQVVTADRNWAETQVQELGTRPLSERTLPTKEQVRESLFAPDAAMDAIREWSQYACHDLRVVTRGPDGSVRYLATRRLEPGWQSNVASEPREKLLNASRESITHKAPINGCWWPPGGRISVPRPGSELEKSGFDVVDSLILKLNRETGVVPEGIRAIHLLGVGETNFSTDMVYTYRGRDMAGEVYDFSLPVEMPAPQRTINKNYVVEISPEAVLKLDSLCSACWIDKDTYTEHREQFCAYEQTFLDALFYTAIDPARGSNISMF